MQGAGCRERCGILLEGVMGEGVGEGQVGKGQESLVWLQNILLDSENVLGRRFLMSLTLTCLVFADRITLGYIMLVQVKAK